MIVIIIFLIVLLVLQSLYIYNIKAKLKNISVILDDIITGNIDRRLLANKNELFSDLVYKINEIVIQNKKKIMKLTQKEKSYKELMTSLSHDIRTPLASIIGYLDVLENGKLSVGERKEYIEIVKVKSLNLSAYLNTLFDWLKLESGEWIYTFENHNICELTRVIMTDWILKLENADIVYNFDIPEEDILIILDKNAYQRAINNIISNTIKHSRAKILNFSLKDFENEIRIDIEDNGIGINQEDIHYIFDRLYKCDKSRGESSNGLGLAIAKELVEKQNGRIKVKSQVNVGTTFSLSFSKSMNKV